MFAKEKYIPTVDKTTSGSPVQLEDLAGSALDGGAGEGESLGSGLGSKELDEAVASVAEEVSTQC